MYNEEVKVKFIREYTHSEHMANFIATLFNTFTTYEESWGADLCTRTKDELQPVVDNVLGLRTRSQWPGLLVLRTYCKWCITNNVPGACDGATQITAVGVDKIRKQMVSGPVHLQKYLDDVFPPVEDETVSIVYRCYFWMAFSGISEADALLVKCSDVDFTNLVIRFAGKEYELYREAIPTFRLAVTLDSFQYFHENPTYVVRRDRQSGDTILRGIKPITTVLSLRSAVCGQPKKAFEEGRTEQRLSYRRAMLSGLFYRNYERERSGLPLNFADVVIEETRGKTYALNRRMKVEHIQNRLERDYLEDYQRWKFVFTA